MKRENHTQLSENKILCKPNPVSSTEYTKI